MDSKSGDRLRQTAPGLSIHQGYAGAARAPTYFHPKSNELATAFGEAVVGVLFGKGQPKPLLDDAAAKMDRILKD